VQETFVHELILFQNHVVNCDVSGLFNKYKQYNILPPLQQYIYLSAVSSQIHQIHCPLLGDKVDYGVGLSYRPAIHCSLMGRYDNPMP
jgi:hypothetical protein